MESSFATAPLDPAAATLANEVVALDALLDAEAERLGERLAATVGWTARLAVAQRWLLARVARSEVALSPDIDWALRRLDTTGGRVAVGTLQAELGCSRRHLAARFRQTVGTIPKRYGQLVRFTRAAERLRAGEGPAAVAAACGYSDQAHLTRHVRRFGATTPGELRRAGAPVTSVQDAAVARA